MRTVIIIAAVVLHVCVPADGERPISILWLGNSYICDNDAGMHLDDAVERMINVGHDSGLTDVVVDRSALNCLWGMGLSSHLYDATSLALATSGDYDYVVLQGYIRTEDEQTMRSSAESEILAGTRLAQQVWEAGSTPVVFCAHPRCDATPSMWDFVIDSYRRLADTTGSLFVPASVAWRKSLAERPDFRLYQSDCIHQNKNGIYLNAATFYSVFTDTTVVGHPVTSLGPSYTPENLDYMQRIVRATCDSVRRAEMQPVVAHAPSVRPPPATLTFDIRAGCTASQLGDAANGGYVAITSLNGRLVGKAPIHGGIVRLRWEPLSPPGMSCVFVCDRSEGPDTAPAR